MKNKQLPDSKVVPFTGEFYPVDTPTPGATSGDKTAHYLVMLAAALIGGLSMGAIFTYQSADQVKLRQLLADSEHLQQVKTQVCK